MDEVFYADDEGRPGGLSRPVETCYPGPMKRETVVLLDAFEGLPAEEKRALAEEILRRSLPFDSGPLADEEIGAASDALFQSLDKEDAGAGAR